MKIVLKRVWFDPSNTRRSVEGNPHTVSDDWKKLLPSDAVIVEGGSEDEPELPLEGKATSDKKTAPAAKSGTTDL